MAVPIGAATFLLAASLVVAATVTKALATVLNMPATQLVKVRSQ